MKKWIRVRLPFLVFLTLCSVVFAQENTPSQGTAALQGTNAQDKNIQEYIALLRADVRQQKSEIMATVMRLDMDDAAKFWPIYQEYNAALTKLNDLRVTNIKEYAQNYDEMTDAKADELVHKALSYDNQRSALLAKYYDRMKASIGAVQAARFLQVEDQLLMIIDLQIASALPIVSKES